MLKGADAALLHTLSVLGLPCQLVRVWNEVCLPASACMLAITRPFHYRLLNRYVGMLAQQCGTDFPGSF